MMRALFVAVGLSIVSAGTSNSVFQIAIPRGLYKDDGGYDHMEAMFGSPKYGVTLSERLYNANSTLCEREAHGFAAGWQPPFLLMVDRGDCSFVTKVRNAQALGASGVVVADDRCLCTDPACDNLETCEMREPVMGDDGSGSDISIPAILVKKSDAEAIKLYLACGALNSGCDPHWNPKNALVQAQLEWAIPSPDNRVEWELWTTSIDETGNDFLVDFRTTVAALGKHQYFTPHFYTFNGTVYGCDKNENCGSLCTNGGRYCAPDPDGSVAVGISGADVVAENLRRACVWRLYGAVAPDDAQYGIGERWWDYIEVFRERCGTQEQFTNPTCVQGAMKSANCDAAAVHKCMSDSGGLEEGQNSILEDELVQVQLKSVYATPECIVNGAIVWGRLDAANVLSSICHGFSRGDEPEACDCLELLNSGDHRYDDCLTHTTEVPVSRSSGKKTTTNSGLPWWGVFVLVVAIVVVMLVAGLLYWKRTQQQMRDQVRGILAEYMPLDDLGGTTAAGGAPQQQGLA